MKRFITKSSISILISLLVAASSEAKVFLADSATEMRNHLLVATSGDTIRIPAGVYSQAWGLIEVTTSNLTIEGESNSPSEQATQRTEFRAPVHFVIRGSNVTLRKIHFMAGTGRSSVMIVGTRAKPARHSRLTQLYFYDSGENTCSINPSVAPGICHASLVKFGEFSESNTLDTCLMRRNYNVAGVFNAVSASSDGHAKNNRVRSCYFGNISKQANGPTNGLDAIMIGTAPSGDIDNHAKRFTSMQIDHNIFVRVEGESEIISSKTYGNQIAFNLFLDSSIGHLRLRAGGQTEVIGNVFRATNGGIVVNGFDHLIQSNLVVPHGTSTPASLQGFGAIHFSGGSDTPRNSEGMPLLSFISSRGTHYKRNLLVSGHPLAGAVAAPALLYSPENSCGEGIPCDTVPFNNSGSENHIVKLSQTSWNQLGSAFSSLNSWSPNNTVFNSASQVPETLDRLIQAIVSPVPNENRCIRVFDPALDPGRKIGDLTPCSPDSMIMDTTRGRVPLRYPGILPRVISRQ